MLNVNEIYVCHIETDVLCVGTKEECQQYKDAQPFNTDSWIVNSLEGYGNTCYTNGREDGLTEMGY